MVILILFLLLIILNVCMAYFEWDYFQNVQSYIAIATIIVGALVFWKNKSDLGTENLEEENKIKAQNEVNISVIRRLGSLIGGRHGISLIVISAIFFITRLFNNEFINSTDNYNVIAIKNMYENGLSFYKYSAITDFLMLKSVEIFGFNFLSIKLPFILYSFVTLIFIYLTAKQINRNLALLSSFLYVISPWAIIQSRITRDYSFDLMIGSIVLYLCFLFYRYARDSQNLGEYFKRILLFSLVPLTIIILSQLNRPQTIIIGIYVLFAAIFMASIFFYMITKPDHIDRLYWIGVSLLLPGICFLLFLGLYSINTFPFQFGFKKPDTFFLEIFFNPLVSSPWQWFHNSNLDSFFLMGLFGLGVFSFYWNNNSKFYLLILFLSFCFSLVLYIFKFETHVDYIPVRYIYFLFAPYVIIFSNSILNLLMLYKIKLLKFILAVSLVMMISPISLMYSVSPVFAYKQEGITNLNIDNIRIGRFDVLEAANYLKEHLKINDDTILVLDGRYGEFIIYLDRPMDSQRFLMRTNEEQQWIYDIAQNTYVQANYFGYYELEQAVTTYDQGIYVSSEDYISDTIEEKKLYLKNDDFFLYGARFNFLEKVNIFRMYSWMRVDDVVSDYILELHGKTFNGKDDYIEVAHDASQLLTAGGSIEAWIKPESAGENHLGKIVDKSTGTVGNNGYTFQVTSAQQLRFVVNNGNLAQTLKDSITFGDGNWYHVVVTVSADALVSFYINGTKSGSSSTTGDLKGIITTNPLTVGNRSGATDRTFDGSIGEVRIYNRELTPLEIFQNYFVSKVNYVD